MDQIAKDFRLPSICLQGVPTGSLSGYVTVGATPKAGEKTSEVVQEPAEIA